MSPSFSMRPKRVAMRRCNSDHTLVDCAIGVGFQSIRMLQLLCSHGGKCTALPDGYFPYGFMVYNRYGKEYIQACTEYIEVPANALQYILISGHHVWMLREWFKLPFVDELVHRALSAQIRAELKCTPPLAHYIGGIEFHSAMKRLKNKQPNDTT